jgi:hypothetical protein
MSLETLSDMLSYRRPVQSRTIRAFIRHYIATLPGAEIDMFHNWHVTVGDNPTILWSSHTDTVHRQGGKQRTSFDGRFISVIDPQSDCLGADDTIGIYLMREMIARGVPGHYIFHYAEEVGGIGSSNLTMYAPELVAPTIRCVIALDRRDTHDVITHQFSGRCASDLFAWSLADQLSVGRLKYRPSDRGLFTDSANYTDLVGECTNVSVGYEHEHSPMERVDCVHVFRLLDALSTMDQSALEYERKPADPDLDDWHYSMAREVTVRGTDTKTVHLDPIWERVQQALRDTLERKH